MTARAQRGQWAVGGVNAGVAGTVLLLVAVLALVVKPPAPPGISAFAPQASKPITKAPLGQSAVFGAAGETTCPAGQVCDGPSASPSVSPPAAGPSVGPSSSPRGVPSALQCYTWPDGSVTQTSDAQSPPCIASWDDATGNGGATAPGVTATEIRVALPTAVESTWPELKPIVDFFNTRFQMYGRKITIVPVPSQQAELQAQGTFNDPAAQRADAASIVQRKVFATTDFVDPIHYSWSLPSFRDVLTRNEVVSLSGGETTPYGTRAGLAKNAPYEWTYYPTADVLMDSVATMTCRQLVGKQAVHASDESLRTKTRKFAVVIPSDEFLGGPMPGLSSLLGILEGCGVEDPRVIRYDYYVDRQSAQVASYRELAEDDVTSLIYFPQGAGTNRGPMDNAPRAGFNPEWITIGWNNYLTTAQLNSPRSATSAAFGVGVWNKMPQLELETWVQAFLAAGGDSSMINSGALYSGRAFYQEMLLLASGVQMAGPRLTPESFAAGLQDTRFPNPGAGKAPSYQATVGFGPGDVAMTDDVNAFWLDTRTSGAEVTASKNLNTQKATCYVELGRRFDPDDWPTTDGFYEGSCR